MTTKSKYFCKPAHFQKKEKRKRKTEQRQEPVLRQAYVKRRAHSCCLKVFLYILLLCQFFVMFWLLKILQAHLASRHWWISSKNMLQIRRFSYRASTQIHIIALTVTDGSVPSSDRAEGLFYHNQLTLTSFNYLLWIDLTALQLHFFCQVCSFQCFSFKCLKSTVHKTPYKSQNL